MRSKVETEIKMMSYDPPHKASVKAIGGPIHFENTYTFEAQGGGTLLT